MTRIVYIEQVYMKPKEFIKIIIFQQKNRIGLEFDKGAWLTSTDEIEYFIEFFMKERLSS
jgi:hypothetical protein